MLVPVGNAVSAGMEMQTLKSETTRTNDVMHYDEDDKFLAEAKNRKNRSAAISNFAMSVSVTVRWIRR